MRNWTVSPIRSPLGLSLKYDITHNFGIFYNLNNFTNQPDESFMQTARYATGREYYGWTTDIGISIKL